MCSFDGCHAPAMLAIRAGGFDAKCVELFFCVDHADAIEIRAPNMTKALLTVLTDEMLED
jgi:hypothetical protein